jgi:hypothetical protein
VIRYALAFTLGCALGGVVVRKVTIWAVNEAIDNVSNRFDVLGSDEGDGDGDERPVARNWSHGYVPNLPHSS